LLVKVLMEVINPINLNPHHLLLLLIPSTYHCFYQLGRECIKGLILVCYDRAHPLDNHTKQKKGHFKTLGQPKMKVAELIRLFLKKIESK